MVISKPRSVNAFCPACFLQFGCLVSGDGVRCLVCGFKMLAPIIQIDQNRFYCVDCDVTFGQAPGLSAPRCHGCGSEFREIRDGP